MRDEFEWEKELCQVYRHQHDREGHGNWHLRISKEMIKEMQASRFCAGVYDSTRDLKWQGIPMRIDETLPPGCFVFDEGEMV